MNDKEKHGIMRREAVASLIAAALVMVFWWAAGFGLARVDFTLFYMPGWFVISCFGSWLLSIGLVIFLITRVFKNFNLEDDGEDAPRGGTEKST
jgi:uncharacterized membrane protein YhdT